MKTELVEIVTTVLNEENLTYNYNEKSELFNFGLCIPSIISRIKYIIDVEDNAISVYGLSPIGAGCDDEQMTTEMAKYICHANYGLSNGSFEFDQRDGELRYKSYIDCTGNLPSKEMIKNSIYIIMAAYRRYAAGIVAILCAGATAQHAIELTETTKTEMADILDEEKDE